MHLHSQVKISLGNIHSLLAKLSLGLIALGMPALLSKMVVPWDNKLHPSLGPCQKGMCGVFVTHQWLHLQRVQALSHGV